MDFMMPKRGILAISASLIVMKNFVTVVSNFFPILIFLIISSTTLLVYVTDISLSTLMILILYFTFMRIPVSLLLVQHLSFHAADINVVRRSTLMKKLKRILNILSRLCVRIAHVAEHVTCDEVPHIEEEED